MNDDGTVDWRCAPYCDRVCSPDYCRTEHENCAHLITGGRCKADADGVLFDSTGLPLERGECTT